MATPQEITGFEVRWFEARYDGVCLCGEPILAGDTLGRDDEGDIIAQDCCAPTGDHTPRREERQKPCPTCFLVHRGECF